VVILRVVTFNCAALKVRRTSMSTFMKKLFLILFLLVAGLQLRVHGRTCTAVATGNWASPVTWSCGSVPANNDTLFIPAGITVFVNCNCGTYSNMVVNISGILYFNNGQKINMTCNGKVYIAAGGVVNGDNAGSKIVICGNDIYNGGMGPVAGPATGDQTGLYSTLPIELLRFDVKLNADSQAELSWTTATETNNDFFTIERTVDGRYFEVVGITDGAGTSTTLREYLVIDPFPYAGTSYYRLKQTDLDGAYEYSDLIALEHDSEKDRVELGVHPNPSTQNDLAITLSGAVDEEVLVTIKDIMGREYSSMYVTLKEGEYKIVIDPSQELMPGVYMVIASGTDTLVSKKLVIK
jgi:hypothetical protein